MLVSIENIDGVEHTVIWYIEPFSPFSDALEGKWLNIDYDGYIGEDKLGVLRGYQGNQGIIEWIALPPLPKNPTTDDAKLLDLYRAHGLYAIFKFKEYEGEGGEEYQIRGLSDCGTFYTELQENEIEYMGRCYNYNDGITHALDEQNNRIEIALKD
jgi:hypothetical protein